MNKDKIIKLIDGMKFVKQDCKNGHLILEFENEPISSKKKEELFKKMISFDRKMKFEALGCFFEVCYYYDKYLDEYIIYDFSVRIPKRTKEYKSFKNFLDESDTFTIEHFCYQFLRKEIDEIKNKIKEARDCWREIQKYNLDQEYYRYEKDNMK